jgi:hypothetical protein
MTNEDFKVGREHGDGVDRSVSLQQGSLLIGEPFRDADLMASLPPHPPHFSIAALSK